MQRRSHRNKGDDRNMLEKAQDLKRKFDLEEPKGKLSKMNHDSLLSMVADAGLV